jgi:hypothetical protein
METKVCTKCGPRAQPIENFSSNCAARTAFWMVQISLLSLTWLCHVFAKAQVGGACQRNLVVVVQHNEFAQLRMPGQRTGLGRHAFHETAVACKYVGKVIYDRMAGFIETCGQMRLGNGQANGIANPLSQWAGGGLNPRREMALGMAGGAAVPLAEILQIFHRQIVTH